VAVERFKREYEAAHEMKNPYIVHVLEFGETNDRSWYLTMEYLQGQELAKALSNHQPIAKPRIVRTICQLASALEHAHSYGFIHRDLKPDNIFLCNTVTGTQVRVLDFGSVKLQMETGAKLTALGTTLGSPYYMSPEQATGASDVDQRSDVFALGAILYEMLTGKVAFDAPNVALILMKILNHRPVPPSTLNPESQPAIDDVVDKALHKNKQLRYASARELAEALLVACGVTGTVDEWAERPEADLASTLASARPPARSAPAAAQPSAAGAGASTAQWPSESLPPQLRVSRPSDVQLTVPNNAPKAKLIVSIAIGVAVLCLLAFLMR
jgi:serine/threonine-protein kinase